MTFSRLISVYLFILLLLAPLALFAGDPDGDTGAYLTIGQLDLTVEEEAWLKTSPVIKTAGPRSFPPFHYYDATGRLKGISADYLFSMMAHLGISVDIQKNLPWPDVLKKAKAGEIDLIPCIAKTADREHYIEFSNPYLSFPMVIISRNDSPFIGGIEDLHDKTLATIQKISTIEWLARDGIKFSPQYENSPLDCLRAVSFGQADVDIENLATAGYLIQKHGLANLKVAAPTPYDNYNLYMGVRKGLPELLSIINKTISAIPPEQHSRVRNRWLSVRYEHGIGYLDIVKWGLLVFVITASGLSLFFVWNRRLKREIKERMRAEKAVRESEERLRTAGKASYDLIYEWDVERGELEWFGDFNGLLGYEAGQYSCDMNAWLDLIHPDDQGMLEEAVGLNINGTEPICYEYRIKHGDGGYRFWRDHALPIPGDDGQTAKWIGVCTDITDRIEVETQKKKLEEHLRQIQKLDAIGRLAGGIAHDFNNMLGVIMGNASYALTMVNENEELFQIFSDIQDGATQARKLTQQLLTFAKGGEPVKKTTRLNILLREAAELVARGSNAVCKFELDEALSLCEVDGGQLNQAISNLVINAIQAMPEGGVVHICAANITIGQECGMPLVAGDYVHIKISDQGSGIPEKYLIKIFDPFFTTKHQGSGLGLATTFSIIQRHSGHIAVSSPPGEGAVFDIYLPASENKTVEIRGKEDVEHKGRGRILIMDDQEAILKMAERLLGRMGYDIATAIDGESTIEAYKASLDSENAFGLVILDLTIPGGMGGAQVASKLLEIDPTVRLVASSGYSNDPVMAGYRHYGFCGVVPKPYTRAQMAELLNDVFS